MGDPLPVTVTTAQSEPPRRKAPRNVETRPDVRLAPPLILSPRRCLSTLCLTGADLHPAPTPIISRPSVRRGRQKDPAWGRLLSDGCAAAASLPPGCRLSLPIEHAGPLPEDLLTRLTTALTTHDFEANRLDLEFTEISLTEDTDTLFYSLAALRDVGVGLILAGFGSGTSSLTLLRDRTFAGLLTGVKLDRHLFQTSDDEQQAVNRSMAHAIIQLASDMGLTTRADGVDTADTLSFLQSIGCREGGGMALGAAEPLPDFLRLYANENVSPLAT